METELKLTTSAASLHAISAQRLLQDFATAEPVTRHVTSHYFDTPDTALQQQGLTLRVRKDAQQKTQTLKELADGAVHAGAFLPGEWETPVPAVAPDLRSLVRADKLPRKVKKTLRRVRQAGNLAEQFVVEAERTTWLLDVAGAKIEMALDNAAAIAPGAKSAFAEIELELKSGHKSALYTAARRLAQHVPVQLSFVTKAERGFALLAQGMRPRKAGPVALRTRASVEQGMRAIFLACLEHAQANAQGFLDGADPEYLHQFRVGLRRFKSALKLFRSCVTLPADLQARLADLAAALGRARDAEVLTLATLPQLASTTKHTALFQPLLALAQVHAAQLRAEAQAAVRTTHAQLMLDLFEWVDGKRWREAMPEADRARLRARLDRFAAEAVQAANARVLKRAARARALGGRDGAALHRLRIACKQARYTVEFFAGMARPARARHYIRRLAGLQDALGKRNDLHVAQTLLEQLPQGTPAATIAIAYLHGMAEVQSGSRDAPWRTLKRARAWDVRRIVRTGS